MANLETSPTPALAVSRPSSASAPLWYRSVRSLLFQMDPEDAHTLAIRLAPFACNFAAVPFYDDRLHTQVAGQMFQNPVGLAAGFDKNGKLTDCLARFGFGFAEIGSITAQSTSGNPKPRLFRLVEDEAVINRLGLNGDGAEMIAQRLHASGFSLPLAVNIAKTNLPSVKGHAGVSDMIRSFDLIKDLPLSFVTLNASCPNTHEGIMQEGEELDQILVSIQKLNGGRLPIFLKLSPDSSEELLEKFVESACRFGINGFVLGNTTTTRGGLKTPSSKVETIGNGGLSGKPLKEKALQLVKRVYKLKQDDQDIIGCGGIASGADAYEFIAAGANAIELYTGMIYCGPDLPVRINRELFDLLKMNDQTVSTAIGTAG